MRRAAGRLAAALAMTAAMPALALAQGADAAGFIRFVEEDDANCVSREGRMVHVVSTHPQRRIRCWLERYHMGQPTGDRSRSELVPAAAAEKLGCSRSEYGKQEWRVVKAQFVD